MARRLSFAPAIGGTALLSIPRGTSVTRLPAMGGADLMLANRGTETIRVAPGVHFAPGPAGVTLRPGGSEVWRGCADTFVTAQTAHDGGLILAARGAAGGPSCDA